MKQYAKVTPEGSRDLLFEECDDRRRVENALTGLYEANGYRKVITPTLEFFDVFNSGDAGLDADEMYKLTDNRGRTTVLRPDNTLPIARLVATRLSEDAFPVRLYYNQSVFVRTKELAGRTDEVAQSGIELIGDGSMAADIQVITLACRAMQSTVPGFKIELGHAGYFGAVLRNLNVKPAVKAEICHLIEQKNFAALGDLLDTLEDCRETRVLRRLPRLFGGPEVLDEARELYTEGGADASLQYIKTLYDTLCAAGLQEQVLLDLGGWIHDHEEAVFGTEKGLDYNHFLGGSTISADQKTMYLFVYDKPQETLCVKGIKTPVKRVTVLHTGEELRFSYTGSLPWSGIPGTLWIWAGEMSIHPFATVVKVELEDEITYNLGHGEVVTFNE